MKNKLLKHLKKNTSYVIVLSMIAFSFLLAPLASATGPTLTISSPSASNGDTVNASIDASDFSAYTSDVGSVTLNIQYDNTLLTYVDTTFNNLPTGAIANAVGNVVTVNWSDATVTTPITVPNAALVTLNFTVISSTVTNTNLSFINTNEVTDHAFDLITTSFVDGVITLNPDVVSPTISSAARDTDTQITVTLSELADAATITHANDGGWVVAETEAPGTTYTVTAVNPGVTDDLVVLNVANMLVSGKEGVTVTYTSGSNGTVTDIAGNVLATDATGVNIAAWDTTVPSVTNVTSTETNGYFKEGDTIDVIITFDEAVIVTGSPQIELETGATDRQAVYASGSGTATLTFTYTVEATDTAPDLDYVATGSLTLNSGIITDTAGNDATLTLAEPAAVGSLGANKAIVIDTTVPTAYLAGPVDGDRTELVIRFNDVLDAGTLAISNRAYLLDSISNDTTGTSTPISVASEVNSVIWDNSDVDAPIATVSILSTIFVEDQTVRINFINSVVKDLAENAISSATNVDVAVLASSQIAATPTVTVNTTQTEVVMNSPNNTSITVPSTVTNATIDINSLTTDNGSGVTATLPEIALSVTTDTFTTPIEVAIPADLVITGPTGWSGIINIPRIESSSSVTATPDSGYTSTVSSVIEIGYNDTELTFNKAIRLLIPGAAGKYVGYSRNGVFTKITTSCSADNQEAGDALSTGGNCKINVGSDLVIWTKHFTKFAAYTQTAIQVSSSGGGGGSLVFYCSTVTYGEWGNPVNGIQYRDVLTQTPNYCSLSTTQQLARSRTYTADVSSETEVEVEVEVEVDQTPISDLDVEAVTAAEKALVLKVNTKLSARLAGRILLQVEGNGEAWYVDPLNQEKYFMGRPVDAFSLMRRFGLGISNANFDKFESSGVPAKFAGRIFLKVEDNGEAYYINPVDLKMHYLGRPEDAFTLMRGLALGISNDNLRQIPVGEIK